MNMKERDMPLLHHSRRGKDAWQRYREASAHASGEVFLRSAMRKTSPPRVCRFAALLDPSAAPPAVVHEGPVAFLHVRLGFSKSVGALTQERMPHTHSLLEDSN